ncbi:MAG: hypothetical protein IT538_13175 [Variibacter sp.]|nr:hypothetical protein [Variibacter sp.]
MIRAAMLARALVAVGGALPAGAQGPLPENENGRYTFKQMGDELLRLDARTGQVSVCAKRAAGWACLLAPDERTALETEISRLQGESARLKREMISRGLPLPSGMQAPSRAEQSSEIIIKLPSEAELDRMREFAEKVLRRFRGMVQELRRELNKKD